MILNEGFTEVLNLIGGISGTAFDNTNAYIGVGDSDSAEVATQTALQAASNKVFKPMETGYPQVSGTTLSFKAVFAEGDANFFWKEFTITNGNSDAAKNLLRQVSNQGEKVFGQIRTVTFNITKP